LVIDPFVGSGTTGMAALEFGRDFLGCDLSAEYAEEARRNITAVERYGGVQGDLMEAL